MTTDKKVTHGVDENGKEWHTPTSLILNECSICGSKKDLCEIDNKIICATCLIRRKDLKAQEEKP